MKYIIAYDLGTGGMKTSLYSEEGVNVGSCFRSCSTYYPEVDFREQRPNDWWDILCKSTEMLLSKLHINKNDIVAAACSGHSLGVVPIDSNGTLLLESVPIWSDARAEEESQEAFCSVDEQDWYMNTGNGFPSKLYPAFKILWYKKNRPEVYKGAHKFIGTKDYLNYRLTGVIATDHSYASGSGVYNLITCEYDKDYIQAFTLREDIFPDIFLSSEVIGTIKREVADMIGLPHHVLVVAGGVDNACMAAGAGCVKDEMAYTSLGTSAWIAVASHHPVLNKDTKPYVFSHLIKGMYVSAEAIFSAGNTYRWVRDNLCQELVAEEKNGGEDAYKLMDRLAQDSVIGANGLFFTPTLAGGNVLDKCLDARGSLVGLDLKHTKGDVIRAVLEGICLNLKIALNVLAQETQIGEEMLIVGGGAKSPFWRTLFADIYGKNIFESAIGEDAGSLGAMACAAIGVGLWDNYEPLIALNKPISITETNKGHEEAYNKLFKIFTVVCDYQSEIALYKKSLFD